MTGCPTDQELESLIDERVALNEAPPDAPTRPSSLLTHHLEHCERCRERVGQLERDRDFMHEIVSALSDVSDTGAPKRAASPTAATLAVQGYDIDGELHRGAQGVVFKARQLSTNRDVALKVLYHESGTSLRMRQRFLREIELAAQLRHPNVVTIFDSGETEDGRLYFAMEYVDGRRFDACAKEIAASSAGRPADYRRRALALFDAVCAGVAHAHHAGVIHRDLKPGNILVTFDHQPKVLDFGLAKATDADVNSRFALTTIAGGFMGTIAYASPEQTRGNPDAIDTRSDIYALGVLLYELITGRLPYDVTGSLSDGINNVLNAPPATPLRWRTTNGADADGGRPVDRDLETIVLKALAKESERRYATVDALRDDLAHYLAGKPISARRDSALYVASRHARRHKVKIVVGLALIGAVAVIAKLSDALVSSKEVAKDAADLVEVFSQRLAQQEMWEATSGVARAAETPPGNAAAVDRNAVITINAPEAPTALNPMHMRRGDLFVCELLFERLFWRTDRLELVPNPHLVESITEDEDPTIRTIRLREGLTWHDGEPLTSADIEFSWRQTISLEVRSDKRRQASRIKDIIPVDPRTFTIQLEQPHATWRVSANFELIPRHRFEPGLSEDPTLRTSTYFQKLHHAPIGSGPFRFEAWDADEIRLAPNPDYEAEGLRPTVAGLRIHWLKSPQARLDAFCAGELDLVELTFEQYQTQIYSDAFERAGREARRPSSQYHYIGWNCRGDEPRLADPQVRQALAMAIDIDRIKAQVTNNLAAACFGPWAPDSPFTAPNVRRFAYRPRQAEQILRGGRSTDKAHRDPKENELKLRLVINGELAADAQIAEIVRDCLEDVGVRVTIVAAANRAEYIERLKEGRFDAYLGAVTPGVAPELHTTEFMTGGKVNFGGYSNSEIDRLFSTAESVTDETERITIFRRMRQILYDEQPRTYLYHEPELWGVSHRLSGVVFSNRGPYYFQPGVIQWWAAGNAEN
ncbi:MAG TPA: ABC transporter substrate-binding protein [Phycisphaerae bacterium]|nr:ABC transporter substrate-binding protein [Phycisphaerae bacterium]